MEDLLTHNKHEIYYVYDCDRCCPSMYILTTQRPAECNHMYNTLCLPRTNDKNLTGTEIMCSSPITDGIAVAQLDVEKAKFIFLMQTLKEQWYTLQRILTQMAEGGPDIKKYHHEKTIIAKDVSISSFESTDIDIYPEICRTNSDVIIILRDTAGIAQQSSRNASDINNRRKRRVKDTITQKKDGESKFKFNNRGENKVIAWTLRSAVILFIFMFSSTEARSNIEFNLMTKPAYFGNNVTVYCRMTSSPGQSVNHMAWFKEKTRQVHIALNSHSYYPSKYQIAVKDASDFMYYYLTILRFAVDDVNILYRCDFGFDSHKEPLNLDSKSFIALPKEGTTQKSFNTTNDNLEGFVRILNIYPMPRCDILYEGHNYTKEVIMTSEQHLVFYNVTLTFAANAKISRCHGVLTISCYFGIRYMSILEEKINYCDDTIDGNSEQYDDGVLMAVLTAGCLLMLSVSLCITCRDRAKRYIYVGSKCCRIDRNDSGNQEINVLSFLEKPVPKLDENGTHNIQIRGEGSALIM